MSATSNCKLTVDKGDNILYYPPYNERKKMNDYSDQIALLAQISQLREMQIFCLKKEQELQKQLKKLKKEEKNK